MLLPLAQKMSKILDRCISKQVRTELVEGLGNTYGFDMARKESMECWLVRVLYHMFYHDKPFQAQLGVMAFLARGSRVTYFLMMEHGAEWAN